MGSAICSGWCIRGLELDLQYFHRIGCRGQQLPTEGGPNGSMGMHWRSGIGLAIFGNMTNLWDMWSRCLEAFCNFYHF